LGLGGVVRQKISEMKNLVTLSLLVKKICDNQDNHIQLEAIIVFCETMKTLLHINPTFHRPVFAVDKYLYRFDKIWQKKCVIQKALGWSS
jgi:hypothetical protein